MNMNDFFTMYYHLFHVDFMGVAGAFFTMCAMIGMAVLFGMVFGFGIGILTSMFTGCFLMFSYYMGTPKD